jgi:hypothetical protein
MQFMKRASVRTTLIGAAVAAVSLGAAVAARANVGPSDSGPAHAVAGHQSVTTRTPTPFRPADGRSVVSGVTPDSATVNIRCGETLTTSVTVNGDLLCGGGAGLVVAGTDVTVNLNGHVIAGSGTSGTGIDVTGSNDVVKDGFVAGWDVGILIGLDQPSITATDDTVSAVRAFNNNVGFSDNGVGTKLTDDIAFHNAHDGIHKLFFGTGAVYQGDHELNNGGAGVSVLNGDAQVINNVANGNVEGIDIATTSLLANLTGNTTDFNSDFGIRIFNGMPIDGGGNKAKGNGYGTSSNPVQCEGVVCS